MAHKQLLISRLSRFIVQCATATHHLITNFTFNLTSDLLILSIPLPLLLQSSTLPVTKKLALTILFSLGLFIMACAIASKYYSFRQPFSPIWIFWYTREASTAVVVTNMAHVWTGIRRVFHLRSFTGSEERRTERPGSQYGPEAGAEEGQGQGQVSARRFSVPFADIGGLLPSRSSMTQTLSSSSFNRMQQNRRPSSVSPAVTPQPKRSSWIPTMGEQADKASNDQMTNDAIASDHQRPYSSPLPPSGLLDVQKIRNPASAEKYRPRGLRRVDSITLLGLPDVVARKGSVASTRTSGEETSDAGRRASSHHSGTNG
jgi:hypothetical protein